MQVVDRNVVHSVGKLSYREGLTMLPLYDHPLSGNRHKVRPFLSMLGLPWESVFIDVAGGKGLRALKILDARLTQRKWLVCDRPMIADLACFPYVGLSREGRLPPDDFFNVLDWIGRVVGLDGYVSMPGLPEPRIA